MLFLMVDQNWQVSFLQAEQICLQTRQNRPLTAYKLWININFMNCSNLQTGPNMYTFCQGLGQHTSLISTLKP